MIVTDGVIQGNGSARNDRRHAHPLSATFAVLLLSACGGWGAPKFIVDEQGEVPIVVNYEPEWGERSKWAVDPSPNLSISPWSNPDPEKPGLADAKRLPDGRIVVADANSGELGFFDASGQVLKRVGGEGTAPGDFSWLSAIHMTDDAVWAFDRMGRWNVFDLEGGLLSTQYFQPLGWGWDYVEPFGNEMAVSGGGCCWDRPSESGFARGSYPVHRFERTGALLDTLTLIPGREMFYGIGDDSRLVMMSVWSRGPVLHGGQRRLYLGSSETMEIRVFGESKQALRVIRVPDLDLAMTEEDRAADLIHVEQTLTMLRGRGLEDAAITFAEAFARRQSKPAYERFIEDSEENLWVARYAPHYPGVRHANDDWTVFDPAGRWLGSVQTPPGLVVTEIGEDYLLGIADVDGHSVVQMHRLKR